MRVFWLAGNRARLSESSRGALGLGLAGEVSREDFSTLLQGGNSFGAILPKSILTQLGVETGDDLDLSFDDGRIVLVPAKRHPRAGWADAAKRIAEAGEDELVWPEFGNAGGADLKW